MKTFRSLATIAALALAAVILTVFPPNATPQGASISRDFPTTYWDGVGATNGFGHITNGIVIPASDVGRAVVTRLNLTSDTAYAPVTVYTNLSPQSANYANSTTTVPLTSTNGFVLGYCIIRYSDGLCDFRGISSINATSIIVTLAPSKTVQIGDLVYPCAASHTFYGVGSLGATNQIWESSGGVLVGQHRQPFAFGVQTTTAASGRLHAVVNYRP